MSRKQAALAGLLGIVGGALAGSPYLDDTGACTAVGGNAFECAMNQAIGPFISALAIGFCVAIVIGHAISLIVRRALAPRPASRPSRRAAVEVDDPYLQIAAWGRPPGARERISAASSQVVDGVVEPASRRPARPDPPAYEPILVHDPRIRPEAEVGRIGARGKPLPTPRNLV